jgi:hypothetical protein
MALTNTWLHAPQENARVPVSRSKTPFWNEPARETVFPVSRDERFFLKQKASFKKGDVSNHRT